jgi:hypothetical protein
VKITFDSVKRAIALRERGLDFNDAAKVFEGDHASWIDDRNDYGETRWITAGWLNGRMIVFVWTARGESRHVISMRHCHAKEERKIRRRFGFHKPGTEEGLG